MTAVAEHEALALDSSEGDLPMLDDGELVDRYVAGRTRVTRLEAENAMLLAEIDRRHAYEPDYFTTEAFLQGRVGDSGRTARRNVAEARGLTEYTDVAAAYAAAEVDRPRVAMLLSAARVSPAAFKRDQAMLVESAATAPMVATYRALEYWKGQTDQSAAQEDADHLHRRRHLHVAQTIGGMVRLDGELDPVGGKTVMIALRSLADPGAIDPGDDRSASQRRADALVDMCADHLQHGEVSESGGSRPQMVVTVSLDDLALNGTRTREMDDGTVIDAASARRIACDAAVSRVLMRGESEVLDVGRTTRVVPSAVRRALILRDKACTHPGCTRPHHWCDAHHVVHWADGGPTSLDNLVLLCRRHHREAHREPAGSRRE